MLAAVVAGAPYPAAEKSIAQIEADLAAGRTTCVAVVQAYLDRIRDLDRQGPALHSIIALNPHVMADARAADAARARGEHLGPLAGVPIILKDNIDSDDDTATTAGSLALRDNVTHRDAPLVRRLTDAGALILGKANLSEWANIRSDHSISGWSAVGGLVRNPYALDRNACGSSAGTGAAVAASLVAAGVGTETNGSITCPSSLTGLVGLKPTVGLVSRTYVVPISHTQDTAGPMTRSVADAALLLTAMAGSDPKDPATAEADRHRTDYVAALAGASLKGKRLGVVRVTDGMPPAETALFETTLKKLAEAGAVLVDVTDVHRDPSLGDAELTVLLTELKVDLNAYLASTSPSVKTRTLQDVIAFNAATPRELAIFGQETFEAAEQTKGLDDPAYLAAREKALRLTRQEGIDAILAKHDLDAIVAPSFGPAWRTDVVTGDHDAGGVGSYAAIAGYPHLTVPMGQVMGLPVGFSFIGPAWSEAKLLALGAAFEALVQGRRAPTFAPSVESRDDVAAALEPSK
ncbi:amidase [Phenylobacterium montanum]|uniref:Amidase n=2 Tax=Phenylobacterium montanum TaxID=2823693 RepID=A0A975G5E6_9CAUL|nr:amidase [Caulobacter sp. S6]